MNPDVLAGAIEAAARVRDAGHLRTFKHAVNDFVGLLATVPDETAAAATTGGVRALQSLAEDVVDCIEERVADIPHASDAQELVSSVYEIRRLLEEVGRWRQHYAIARHV